MKGMSKRLIALVWIVMLGVTSLLSQDLIVTSAGDSLNCKITDIKDGCVYFTFIKKERTLNTLIAVEQVQNYQYGYYEKQETPQVATLPSAKSLYPKFRIAASGGYGYRLGRIPDYWDAVTKEFARKLKHGYHIGGDITYYFTEQMGVGFKYSGFHSQEKLNGINEEMNFYFAGPSYSQRLLNYDKTNAFIMSISIGYADMNDIVAGGYYTRRGSTVGFCYDIGYDIGIGDGFAIGFQVSFILATITHYTETENYLTRVVTLEDGIQESLSRLEFSVGLRFNK
ncbi:MAG: hypothetical protein LBV41_00545 [Cytophagaceae bacterium]|jgi:hypothetical protein|nr:hypothetical protein [Cytophagaceae bacterium]